jgi:hypothetical protein
MICQSRSKLHHKEQTRKELRKRLLIRLKCYEEERKRAHPVRNFFMQVARVIYMITVILICAATIAFFLYYAATRHWQ